MADTTRNIDEILNKLNTLLPQLKLTTDQMNVLKASMEGVGKTFSKDIATAGDQVKTLNSLLEKTAGHIVNSFGGVRLDLINQVRDLQQELRKVNREAQQTKETLGGGAAFQMPQGARDRLTGQTPASADSSPAVDKRIELGKLLKSQYVSEKQALDALSTSLQKYGMSIADISSATKDVATGTTIVTARQVEGETATKQLTIAQDNQAKSTVRSASAFKSFGAQLADNITKVAKWTVAIALVYGPLQQMQEQIGIGIDNQTEMANIAVILGNEQEKLALAFSAVTDAANLTGESIQGVLQGYTQALRATGSIADETKRLETANTLLTDSLILSKLSTLDQAKAMDILIAALKQAGLELDQGELLLDKWVAVMREASVDMRTLAESYAIVGTIAESAGIQVGGATDELAGLVAVLAQATPLTATQTGNAMRAIISGMSSEGAGRELRKFGISIRDINGELRSFFEISTDISKKYEAGLISDTELAKLSTIIGGGIRRGPQVETIIKGLPEAQRINEKTMDSAGASEEALTTKTEDLNTAITRLGNAFQELSNTLGEDGGLLDTAGTVLKIFTGIISAIDGIASGAGKAAPALFAMSAIFGISKMKGGIGSPFSKLSSGIDQRLVGRTGFGSGMLTRPGSDGRVPRQFFGKTPGQLATGVGIGAGLVGMSALSNAQQGRGDLAAANLAGGFLGIITGSPLLAVAGSAIAEAVVGGMQDLSGDVGKAFAEAFADEVAVELADGGAGAEELSIDEQIRQALPGQIGAQFFEDLGAGEAESGFMRAVDAITGQAVISLETGMNDLFAILGAEGFEDKTRLQIAAQIQAREAPELAEANLEALKPLLALQTGAATSAEFGFYGRQQAFGQQYGGQIGGLQEKYLAQVQAQLTGGELSQREVVAKRGVVGGLDATISSFLAGQLEGGTGEDFIQMGDRLIPIADAIEAVADAYINATSEQQDIINASTATIQQYEQAIEAARDAKINEVQVTDDLTISMAGAVAGLKDMKAAQTDYIAELSKLQAYANFVPANIQNLGTGVEAIPPDVLALMNRLAPQWQSKFEQQKFGGDQGLIDVYRETGALKDIQVQYGATGTEYETLQGQYDPAALAPMFEYMKGEGLIPGTEGTRDQPSFLDLSEITKGSSEEKALWAEYKQILGELGEVGYQEDLQDTIAIWGGRQLEAMQVDNTIIQMLLRNIRDNTEDMVDGIYNLPSDGTFTVPYTGYASGYSNRSPGGGGGDGRLTYEEWQAIDSQLAGGGTPGTDPTDPFGGGTADIRVGDGGWRLGMGTTSGGTTGGKAGGGFLASVMEQLSSAASSIGSAVFPQGGQAFKDALLPGGGEKLFPGLFGGRQEFSGGPLEGGQRSLSGGGSALENAANALAQLNESIASQPIAVNVDITARFTSELDGRIVADETKKFITEDVVRKAGISNVNISAAI